MDESCVIHHDDSELPICELRRFFSIFLITMVICTDREKRLSRTHRLNWHPKTLEFQHTARSLNCWG